jgi:rSAM/selenodomain-associated transferase 2
MRLSIIVPMLNEAAQLPELLAQLRSLQQANCEIILVDGGSSDGSTEPLTAEGYRVLHTPPGRALQMNTGAARSGGEVLLFLHADTRLPEGAIKAIDDALVSSGRHWGRFDVRISGRPLMLKVIAWLMNRRSCLTGVATGDQAIFVRRDLFERVHGFPPQPLMEDIELSKRLRAVSPPVCINMPVTTSGRRWESRGVWRTIFLMWRLRWAYWRGTDAAELARLYR